MYVKVYNFTLIPELVDGADVEEVDLKFETVAAIN